MTPEPDFANVVATLAPCDLVLVEGYKSAIRFPRSRYAVPPRTSRQPLSTATDPNVIAIAADHPGRPTKSFLYSSLDDIDADRRFRSPRI